MVPYIRWNNTTLPVCDRGSTIIEQLLADRDIHKVAKTLGLDPLVIQRYISIAPIQQYFKERLEFLGKKADFPDDKFYAILIETITGKRKLKPHQLEALKLYAKATGKFAEGTQISENFIFADSQGNPLKSEVLKSMSNRLEQLRKPDGSNGSNG